jgi:predicted phage terminase large subunit-like protein
MVTRAARLERLEKTGIAGYATFNDVPLDTRAAAEMELRRRERNRQPEQPLSLMEFISTITPNFQPPLHLRPIVEAFERVLVEPVRLGIVVPPRHYKTETILHGIAWVLKQRPDLTTGFASYAQTFSESKALKAHRYSQRAGVVPDEKMKKRSEWRTREGGGLLATGIGGPLTGQGLDLGIIDDPTKNREEAESKTMRDKHWGWFEDVYETRFSPNASSIVLMTRWHDDDLMGRIMRHRPEYQIIRIPALADCLDAAGKAFAPDVLGRAEGEALLPTRYPAEKLEKNRAEKPYTFASLYQGLPRLRESTVFAEPTFYETVPENVRYSVGVDLAYTALTRANYSAAVVMAVHEERYYVIHVERWQTDITATVERLKTLQARYPVRFSVEANGPQKAVCDMLELRGLKIYRLNPTTDKYVRAQPLAEAWKAGRVLLPRQAAWLRTYLNEMQDFTGVNDAHDDQVDATANAMPLVGKKVRMFTFD